ncbi:phage minor capsid protein [Micromonospora sp. WMMD1274]|uniref:phage minor capsid protein n=1 Tax=Micromonospora sp. WMMD1274 TaxID=3404116 RepID=UPI003B92B863
MPVSRTIAEDLARVLVELYAAAETQLAIDIARRLSEGIDSPDWADRKLTALGTLRRWAEQLLRRLNGAMADEVAQAIVLAYIRGGNAAMQELARLQSTHPEWIRLARVTSVSPALQETITAQTALTAAALAQVSVALPGVEASQSLAFSLVSKLQGTHLRILRWDLDAYREVVARASQDVLLGTATRRRAAQVAWERLLSRGVTGFVDKSGRNWELASYVEMAVRTTVAQAAVQGHLDRLAAAGLDLVIVSDSPQECIKCRPWEGKVLARVGVGARTLKVPHTTRAGQTVTVEVAGSVAEAITAGLMHPNCFPAEVLVSAPSGVVAADARRYEGPLVVIHTASGDELPVTPNHPVLTPEGWVPAGQLQVGQSVLRYCGDVERSALGAPDDEQVPARIGDVFDALRKASPVPAVRVPVTSEQFHGDGLGSDVDVVLTDGLLRDGPGQECSHRQLIRGGVRARSLLAGGTLDEIFLGALHPAHGLMGGSELGSALLGAHMSPLAALSLAPVGAVTTTNEGGTDGRLLTANLGGDLGLRHPVQVEPDGGLDPVAGAPGGDASRAQLPVEGGAVDSHGGRDLVGALSGLVAADRVVEVEQRREWAGHVYNLQTRDGWYVAGGIVVHNCRHSLSAYLPGITRAPTNTEDPEGDRARQHLRYLERQVRAWKLRQEAVIDPAAAKTAGVKVRAYQARIRDHVAATGLIRQPARERIGTAR